MTTGHQPDPITVCCPLCEARAVQEEVARAQLPRAVRRIRRCSSCGGEWWSYERPSPTLPTAAQRYAEEQQIQPTSEERHMAKCKKSSADIEWKEAKNGKRTLASPDGSSHWATCPHAASFRRQGAGVQGADDWGDAS